MFAKNHAFTPKGILQTSRNLFCDKPLLVSRYPYLDMVRGFYHCLQVEPGIITDLAGTPFPGFRGQGCAFSDISGYLVYIFNAI